ncbi:MAG: hypothetical protein C4530_06400 [Desulfobacteraceae bacterium]|nr:MAG: hypothetical protein C4530_06400 [Desulfobacteraceae bacterium]
MSSQVIPQSQEVDSGLCISGRHGATDRGDFIQQEFSKGPVIHEIDQEPVQTPHFPCKFK